MPIIGSNHVKEGRRREEASMGDKRRDGKNSFSCTKIPKFVKLDIVGLAFTRF